MIEWRVLHFERAPIRVSIILERTLEVSSRYHHAQMFHAHARRCWEMLWINGERHLHPQFLGRVGHYDGAGLLFPFTMVHFLVLPLVHGSPTLELVGISDGDGGAILGYWLVQPPKALI